MFSFLRALLLTGLPIFVLVTLVEYFWRNKKYHNEYTRKFIHIIAGTYVAFWPLFISWGNIELLGIGALFALILSRVFNIYKSMHLVRNNPMGEFLSAIVVTLIALMTHDRLLFAVAILHLSLADGFAAVIGTKFGKKNSYRIFGNLKSVVGSGTFFVISVFLISLYVAFGHHQLAWPTLIWLPIIATLVENVSGAGTDNLLVPLVVASVLHWL